MVLILERSLQGVRKDPWNFQFPNEPQHPKPGGTSNIWDLPVRCPRTFKITKNDIYSLRRKYSCHYLAHVLLEPSLYPGLVPTTYKVLSGGVKSCCSHWAVREGGRGPTVLAKCLHNLLVEVGPRCQSSDEANWVDRGIPGLSRAFGQLWQWLFHDIRWPLCNSRGHDGRKIKGIRSVVLDMLVVLQEI